MDFTIISVFGFSISDFTNAIVLPQKFIQGNEHMFLNILCFKICHLNPKSKIRIPKLTKPHFFTTTIATAGKVPR